MAKLKPGLIYLKRLLASAALCASLLLPGFGPPARAEAAEDTYSGEEGAAEALAEALSEASEDEYDGFLLGVEEGAEAAGLEACGLERVAEGIYKADSLGEVAACLTGDYILTGDVEYIEPNYYVEPAGASAGAYEMMKASYAAGLGLDGSDVRVAVIDNGVNPADFDAGRLERYTVFNDGVLYDPSLSEANHGTCVASVIAGKCGNGLLADGVAPGATLVSIKVFDSLCCTIGNVITAINRAVDIYGCHIINLSLGGEDYSASLNNTMQRVIDKGVIVVAAAGNSADKGNPIIYPAAYDRVVGVGAVGADYAWQGYSTYNAYVDCAALGVYSFGGGTSYAAPAVAAAAAITRQANPALTAADFEALLQSRCMDLGQSGRDDKYGWGFVRLDWLLSQAPVVYDTTATDSVTTLRVNVLSPEISSVIKAGYSPEGRLLSAERLTGGGFALPLAAGERLKLFFLREDCSPAAEAVSAVCGIEN